MGLTHEEQLVYSSSMHEFCRPAEKVGIMRAGSAVFG